MNEPIQSNDIEDEKEQEVIEDPREIFIRNLMVKKEEIEKVILDLKEKQKGYNENFSSYDVLEEMDRADAEISSQQYYSFLERKNSELKKIETLIYRVFKNEEFGWCEECGERISQARLSVMPDATRCTACQSEYERWESRAGISVRSYRNPPKEVNWEDEDSGDSEDLGELARNIAKTLSFEDMEEVDVEENPPNRIERAV
jgi:DnaK suppressor protein